MTNTHTHKEGETAGLRMIPRSLVFQARAGQRQSGSTAGHEYSFRCISREAQQRHSNGGKHMRLEVREIQAGEECLIDYVNNTNISSNLHIDHVNSASANKLNFIKPIIIWLKPATLC